MTAPAPPASVSDEAREIIEGFLQCAEIADCAPDDKDADTDALERRARKWLLNRRSPPADSREREELEALRPFAVAAERYNDILGVVRYDDSLELWQNGWRIDFITVGDLRRARALLFSPRDIRGEELEAEKPVTRPMIEFMAELREKREAEVRALALEEAAKMAGSAAHTGDHELGAILRLVAFRIRSLKSNTPRKD